MNLHLPRFQSRLAGATERVAGCVHDIKCYNYRQPRHMIKDCNKPIRPPNSCFTCGDVDHQFRSCPIRVTRRLQQTVASVEDQQAVADVIGMFSYFRRFVPSHASIARPLVELLKKGEPFRWMKNK